MTFKGLVVSCPSSPGAAAFYIDGKDFPGISNVTCDGCDLTHMVMGALFTAPAPGSGVRNSRIHQGTTTNAYYEIVGRRDQPEQHAGAEGLMRERRIGLTPSSSSSAV